MKGEKFKQERLSAGWQLSRRDFVAASTGLLLPRWAWTETTLPEVTGGPVLVWQLNDHNDLAMEELSGSSDPITSRIGHAIWVGGGRDRALRLDGYSVWIAHTPSAAVKFSGAMTIAAWVALEAYPVNDAAIVHMGADPYCTVILDKWGYLQFSAGPLNTRAADARNVCRSAQPVPRGKWVHLAAAIDDSGDTNLFLDGVLFGHLAGLRGRRREGLPHRRN